MRPSLYYPNLSSTWPRTNATQIVTRVESFKGFYLAETYHQNFLALHSDDPYIVFNELPKLGNLKKTFPDPYLSAPVC